MQQTEKGTGIAVAEIGAADGTGEGDWSGPPDKKVTSSPPLVYPASLGVSPFFVPYAPLFLSPPSLTTGTGTEWEGEWRLSRACPRTPAGSPSHKQMCIPREKPIHLCGESAGVAAAPAE